MCHFRECVSTGAAGARTSRSLGHHLLHPLILRLLFSTMCTRCFETQSSKGCTCTRRSKFIMHSLQSIFSYYYTVLYIFEQLLFWDENQGNHYFLNHSCYPSNFDWMFNKNYVLCNSQHFLRRIGALNSSFFSSWPCWKFFVSSPW